MTKVCGNVVAFITLSISQDNSSHILVCNHWCQRDWSTQAKNIIICQLPVNELYSSGLSPHGATSPIYEQIHKSSLL